MTPTETRLSKWLTSTSIIKNCLKIYTIPASRTVELDLRACPSKTGVAMGYPSYAAILRWSSHLTIFIRDNLLVQHDIDWSLTSKYVSSTGTIRIQPFVSRSGHLISDLWLSVFVITRTSMLTPDCNHRLHEKIFNIANDTIGTVRHEESDHVLHLSNKDSVQETFFSWKVFFSNPFRCDSYLQGCRFPNFRTDTDNTHFVKGS